MINILVTGAKGFIGKRLISVLVNKENINVLSFCREDSLNLLEEYAKKADFIYHFAGEVRPKCSKISFISSNFKLTENLIYYLKKHNRNTPILFTSTIHAADPISDYGITKRSSELLIESYAKKCGISSWVYRLPHVFGIGCKPNYNSVLTTWIYNSINDLGIDVFNRSIEMNYSYVDDLIDEFIVYIDSNWLTSNQYIYPKVINKITLGELADLILSFKPFNSKLLSEYDSNSFEYKLYTTYHHYYINKNDKHLQTQK